MSDGRLGYAHIRSMSDRGYRKIFEEIFGKAVNKEGIVLDTRFNGGGWLHDDLATSLATACATCNLGQYLEGALGGAKVGQMKRCIGVDHSHQCNVGEIQALGDHLRAQQDL